MEGSSSEGVKKARKKSAAKGTPAKVKEESKSSAKKPKDSTGQKAKFSVVAGMGSAKSVEDHSKLAEGYEGDESHISQKKKSSVAFRGATVKVNQVSPPK